MGKPTMWFLNRSDTNRAVQPQMTARRLKFWIKEEEGLYYPCSENKGADQLRSSAPLFLHMQIVGFPMGRLITVMESEQATSVMQKDVIASM